MVTLDSQERRHRTLSLTIQHLALRASSPLAFSKWECMFPYGGGWVSPSTCKLYGEAGWKKVLRQCWWTSQEAGVKITRKTSVSVLVFSRTTGLPSLPLQAVCEEEADTLLKVRFLQLGATLKVCFAKSMFHLPNGSNSWLRSAFVLIFRYLLVAPSLETNKINII